MRVGLTAMTLMTALWTVRAESLDERLAGGGAIGTYIGDRTNTFTRRADCVVTGPWAACSVFNNDKTYWYTRMLTLVTPEHALCAKHWQPVPGTTYYWVDDDHRRRTSSVVEVRGLQAADLAVCRLDPPVEGIAPASLLRSTAGLEPGVPMVWLDQQLGIHVADTVKASGGTWQWGPPRLADRKRYWKQPKGGDSSAPFFVLTDDGWALATMATTPLSGASIPYWRFEINQLIERMGRQGHRARWITPSRNAH